jgi:hypothetical protein
VVGDGEQGWRSSLSHPLIQIYALELSLVVKSRSTERLGICRQKREIREILSAIYGSRTAGNKRMAEDIIDHLTKLDFESYRFILNNPLPAVPSDTPASAIA